MTPILTQSGRNLAILSDQIVSIDTAIWGHLMSKLYNSDHFKMREVLDLVLRERETSLSAREWKHRLAGYGYAIKDTLQGQVVVTLPHREQVCILPA